MTFHKYIILSTLIFLFACNSNKKIAQNNAAKEELAIKSDEAIVGEALEEDMVENKKAVTEKSEEVIGNQEKDETAVSKTSSSDSDFQELENALLWEITSDDLEQTSYLYGTIHMIDADKFFWPDHTMEAFEASEKVAFEIDLDDMFNMGAMFGMIGKMMMKDGKTLKDILDDEEYELVNNHFKDIGLPMMMLERVKPMFLSVFAEGGIEPGGSMESSGMASYEMVLYEKAQEKEFEVMGLETMDDQIAIFDEIPYEEQADMLIETIKSSDGSSDQMDELVNMYLTQNINQMVQTVTEEDSEYKDFEDLILNNRNRNWIPHMANMMKEAPTFFAVGAGHLGGPEGVINLLRAEGYTLKPLSEAK